MEFKVNSENSKAKLILEKQVDEHFIFLKLKAEWQEKTEPEKISVSWNFPAKECYSLFGPSLREMRNLDKNWCKKESVSRFNFCMPIHSVVSAVGRNRLLISVSDAVTPISIKTGVREETSEIECVVEFFTKLSTPRDFYEATIRLDLRDIPYYDSVYDTIAWWEKDCGYKPMSVPEVAKKPMYSTWYSFHQMLDREELLKECRLAKELGMECIIIDDGWQTDDCTRGYSYCGDWKVSDKKLGDIKSFVEEVHNIGLRVMFWFPVPFVGFHTEAHKRLQGMFSYTNESERLSVLDPRYKEVRNYLLEIYVKAVSEWGLDGLKLDFIDCFELGVDALKPDALRDFVSVEEAVEELLKTVISTLTKIKPDILIEFRQNYIGPAVRRYGNILRVMDCPDDALRNRTDTINLRLTSGKTAVHSDMLMWNSAEAPEHAALQIASCLYSVPQISVRIGSLSLEHKKMLSFYLKLWCDYRDVLLNGYLTVKNPESNYSQVFSSLGPCNVYTVFTDTLVENTVADNVIVNVSARNGIIVKDAKGKYYRTVNCMGEELSKGEINNELFYISAPLSGVIYITE